eukprot:Hpha_TRINITY_DN15697_c1_g10::TRINITY_DN15697_c1_g10_i1::g.98871::m.98871/K03260/EIF4G; translation initiation factor 4G
MAVYFENECWEDEGYPPPPVHPAHYTYHRPTYFPPTAMHSRPRPSARLDIVNPNTQEKVTTKDKDQAGNTDPRAGWGNKMQPQLPSNESGLSFRSNLSARAVPFCPTGAPTSPSPARTNREVTTGRDVAAAAAVAVSSTAAVDTDAKEEEKAPAKEQAKEKAPKGEEVEAKEKAPKAEEPTDAVAEKDPKEQEPETEEASSPRALASVAPLPMSPPRQRPDGDTQKSSPWRAKCTKAELPPTDDVKDEAASSGARATPVQPCTPNLVDPGSFSSKASNSGAAHPFCSPLSRQSSMASAAVVVSGSGLSDGGTPITRQGSALPKMSGLDAVARKVNGVLNRMTPEKFPKLLTEVLRLLTKEVRFSGENMRVLLGRTAAMIFEKAVSEAVFADMYAELCQELHKQVDSLGVESGETGEGIIKTSKQRLQALLLNLCQKEFEASLRVQRQALIERGTADEEAELRAKQRKVGNITFIAALFKRQLMPEQIVHLVVQRLLNMSSQTCEPPADSDIEILCKLLEVAGERMDRPAAAEYMGRYFGRLRKLLTSHPSSRARYLILGIVELRELGWRKEVKAKHFTPTSNASTTPVDIRSPVMSAPYSAPTGTPSTPATGPAPSPSPTSMCSLRSDSQGHTRSEGGSESPPDRALFRKHSAQSLLSSPLSRPADPGSNAPGTYTDPVCRTVYVTGIDTGLAPGELDAFLSLHGRVVKRRLCGDPSHATQFGFFEFDSQEAALSLLRQEGAILGSHSIHCSIARAAIHDKCREDEAPREVKRIPSSAGMGSLRRPRLPSVLDKRKDGSFGGATPPSKPIAGESFADRFSAALPGTRGIGRSSNVGSSMGTSPSSTGPLRTARDGDEEEA